MPCASASAAQATLDRGHRRSVYANVGLGLGASAIAAAAALWFLGAPLDPSTTAVAPTASTTGAGVAVSGRF